MRVLVCGLTAVNPVHLVTARARGEALTVASHARDGRSLVGEREKTMRARSEAGERARDGDERPRAPRPASLDAVRALQRSAGNQATAALLARTRPARPVLQRRWLFGDDPAIFFWEDEPGSVMPEEETERPEFQGRQWHVRDIPGVPEPPNPPYQVREADGRLTQVGGNAGPAPVSSHGRTPKPSVRSGPPKSASAAAAVKAMGIPTYNSLGWHLKMFGKTSRAKQGSTFNPFGRFSSNPYSVHLNPAIPRDERKSIYTLLGKDKKFAPSAAMERDVAAGDADLDLEPTRGYPPSFNVGLTPYVPFIESEWGVLYRPQADRDLAAATPNAAPTNTAKLLSELPLVGSGSEFKYGRSLAIDPALLLSWANTRKSSQSQTSVMGQSAAKVAANAGYPVSDPRQWEWLHMIAYSLGGLEGVQPQRPENLVVGTAECNTQMIVAEEMIKSIVKKNASEATQANQLVVSLEAWVRMADVPRHIAQRIGYTFKLADATGAGLMSMNFSFDALSRVKPLEGLNRVVRHYGDVHYAAGAGKRKRYPATSLADLHTLRERPVATRRPDGSEIPVPEGNDDEGLPLTPEYDYTDPEEIAFDQDVESVTSLLAEGQDVFLSAVSNRWKTGGTLYGEMFDRAAETLEPSQFPGFITQLRQQPFGEPAVRRLLSSALSDDRLSVSSTLFPAIAPAYGAQTPDALPDDLARLCTYNGEGPLPTDQMMMDDEVRNPSPGSDGQGMDVDLDS